MVETEPTFMYNVIKTDGKLIATVFQNISISVTIDEENEDDLVDVINEQRRYMCENFPETIDPVLVRNPDRPLIQMGETITSQKSFVGISGDEVVRRIEEHQANILNDNPF